MNFLPTAILVCLIVLYSDFLLKSLLAFSPIYNDAAEPWEIGFQDSATTVHGGIVSLHDNIMFYLILIIIGVLWMILTILSLFSNKNNKLVYNYITKFNYNILKLKYITYNSFYKYSIYNTTILFIIYFFLILLASYYVWIVV
jgi:heme/copper-type cytochrome/quinol oxidase subunit 2